MKILFKLIAVISLMFASVSWAGSNQSMNVSLYSLRTMDLGNVKYFNIKQLIQSAIMDTGYRLVVNDARVESALNEPVPPILKERHTMKIVDYLVYSVPDSFFLVIDDDNQLITYKTDAGI